MNAAHLHLISVHFPVVLVPTALILFLIGLKLDNRSVKITALCTFIAAAAAAGAAFLLGEGAEDVLEDFAKVAHSAIEEHEEAADWALWLTVGLGILGAVGAFSLKLKDTLARPLTLAVVILGVMASAALAVTAQQGGKIRHPEAFETSAKSVQDSMSGSLGSEPDHYKRDDDDD